MNNDGIMVDGNSDNYNDASFAAISNGYTDAADRDYENKGNMTLTKSQRIPQGADNFSNTHIAVRKNTLHRVSVGDFNQVKSRKYDVRKMVGKSHRNKHYLQIYGSKDSIVLADAAHPSGSYSDYKTELKDEDQFVADVQLAQ